MHGRITRSVEDLSTAALNHIDTGSNKGYTVVIASRLQRAAHSSYETADPFRIFPLLCRVSGHNVNGGHVAVNNR